MSYLDYEKLRSVSAIDFRSIKPYPWMNPEAFLTEEGFALLRQTLPDISLFKKTVGMERDYGQKPHDRYELKYRVDLPIAREWHEFMRELEGPLYRTELSRLLGTARWDMHFQWQYSYAGCSVSPHCDSASKLGSHIFYFNTPEDWKEEWGGKTLVLDDAGELDCNSAPEFSAFRSQWAAKTMPNRSFLFMRTPHSWHAVGELTSPPGMLRKIFTIVYDKQPSLLEKAYYKIRGLLSAER